MKHCVYDIRGTNGSGKSTLVRNLLKRNENTLILNELIPYHFIEKFNLVVIGRYDKSLTGGVDSISVTSDVLQKFMRKKLKNHNVLLEGIIVSGVFERWNEMASDSRWNYKFIFLMVYEEECIRRVIERRENKGNFKEFNPSTLIAKRKAVQRNLEKFKENGHYVRVLENPSKKEAYKALISELKSGEVNE